MANGKPTSDEFLWVEEGVPQHATIATVAPIIPVHRSYSFTVPPHLESSLSVGQRVRIPVGKKGRSLLGFVTSIDRKPWDNTLPVIADVVDAESFLSPHLLELGRRISEHYASPLGITLKAMTPEAVRRESGLKTVRTVRLALSRDEIVSSPGRKSAARLALIDFLATNEGDVPLDRVMNEAKVSAAVIRAAAKLGWVQITEKKVIGPAESDHVAQHEPVFSLNDEQQTALTAIEKMLEDRAFRVALLFGVSGSGKTEVYIHAMRRVIAAGGQAILLVPEIVLTTQLVVRLTSRFDRVAVVHSGLTDSQRSVMFRQVARGEKDVVIGTRSAVFAPCPNLGIICVDEEQEPSYKNMQSPRFHVRDVAIMRAQLLGIPVVLGSATPSVETWRRATERADHQLLSINRRVRELPMPKVHLVDMRDEFAERGPAIVLSRLLELLLSQTLARGEQAILLMNRRGYANRVFCPSCRIRIECPNCRVGLVVHTSTGHTICHYCRTKTETPTICPNVACRGRLEHFGLGTQQVEKVISAKFPNARMRRVDSDTMRHRSDYQKLVDDFSKREIDVLVGTQMIAKGLDFPFVSLVGVVQADAVSLASDFRSQERLFQLITQVAGRAGRGDAPGSVVVQTLVPDLPALRFALEHDFVSFANYELTSRSRVGLPPFRRLARFVLSHPREETARACAETLKGRIHDAITSLGLPDSDVLGPNPCPLARLRGQYRYDLLIRTADAPSLHRLLQYLQREKRLNTSTTKLMIDVDPVSMA